MIGVALLGAGIGAQHLDAYLKLHDQFKVLWIIDKDTQKAEQLAARTDCRVSAGIADALNDPDVGLIDICLAPHLHVATTLRALEAGKDVVCEKPLATSLSDAMRVETASKKHRRRVFPVFQYRWGPAFYQLERLIEQGLAGRPLVAAVETHWSRDKEYYAAPWRGTWAGEQGGAVLGHAIHAHDLVTRFMGPVASVSAFIATRVNEIETEDCASISLQLANGALATSNITLGAATNETRMRFVFENLTATSDVTPYAPGTGRWQFTARVPTQQRILDEALAQGGSEPIGFEGFLHAVALELCGESNRAVSLEDGVASIALVTAIYHAARTGQRVDLPLPADHPLFEGWQP